MQCQLTADWIGNTTTLLMATDGAKIFLFVNWILHIDTYYILLFETQSSPFCLAFLSVTAGSIRICAEQE